MLLSSLYICTQIVRYQYLYLIVMKNGTSKVTIPVSDCKVPVLLVCFVLRFFFSHFLIILLPSFYWHCQIYISLFSFFFFTLLTNPKERSIKVLSWIISDYLIQTSSFPFAYRLKRVHLGLRIFISLFCNAQFGFT